MSYHEINLFHDAGLANAKVAEHKRAGRKNVTVRPATADSGHQSLIVYDNTNGKDEVIFDEEGSPGFFVVESDGQ